MEACGDEKRDEEQARTGRQFGGSKKGRERERSFVVFAQSFSSFYGIVLAHCAIFP